MINDLSIGTVLRGNSYQYVIERTLGQGSFGITYLASVKMAGALGAIDANIKVAIKEFFMRDINGRSDATVTSGNKGGIYDDYKRKFTREAVNLSKLQHPNIIKVIESFEANNTVYYVMEYIDGGSLDDYITKNNGLKEDEAIKIVKQIGSALSFMHKNKMLHLDLKPSNIMRKESGDIVLIDFGLSKQYDEKGEPESSTKVGAGTPGYAPLEQANYREGKGFPVTMDVYALGATMFKMLTGVRPPEASDILNEGFPLYELQEHNVSNSLSACIAKAMAPIKKDRCQSVGEFIISLDTEETTINDVELTDKKTSHYRNNEVKEYNILPNTSRVKIEYSPMTPFESGRYIASIGSNDMSLGRFEGSTYLTYPINEGRYKKFLSDLQDLNLSITDERLINYNEFSEKPEKLIISLYDNKGKNYAKFWGSGLNNEFGNIVGDIREINEKIKIITPNLQDYVSSMYKQEKVNFPIEDMDIILPHHVVNKKVYGWGIVVVLFVVAVATFFISKKSTNEIGSERPVDDTPNMVVVDTSSLVHIDKNDTAKENTKAAEKAKAVAEQKAKETKAATEKANASAQEAKRVVDEIVRLRKIVLSNLKEARNIKEGDARKGIISTIVRNLNTLCTKDPNPRNKKIYKEIKGKLSSTLSYSNSELASSHYNILIKKMYEIK